MKLLFIKLLFLCCVTLNAQTYLWQENTPLQFEYVTNDIPGYLYFASTALLRGYPPAEEIADDEIIVRAFSPEGEEAEVLMEYTISAPLLVTFTWTSHIFEPSYLRPDFDMEVGYTIDGIRYPLFSGVELGEYSGSVSVEKPDGMRFGIYASSINGNRDLHLTDLNYQSIPEPNTYRVIGVFVALILLRSGRKCVAATKKSKRLLQV